MDLNLGKTSRERPRARGGMVGEARRLRVVAFGGGTGLPILLAGLGDHADAALTAVVTVADDGGSSGRLRRQLGIAPPGDLRNCLAALAGHRRLADVFDHRFQAGEDLRGHALGNLIIAGLVGMSGDLCAGVEQAASLLGVRGAIYPAACSALTLVLHTLDGTTLEGESSVEGLEGSLVRVEALPSSVGAPPGAIAAIERSDVVVLSAGSLFTSTIASLLGSGTREALADFAGPVVYVANLLTQPGETAGFTVADHVRAIGDHGVRVTDVLVPVERLPAAVARRCASGAAAVEVDEAELERLGVKVRRARLLSSLSGTTVRHDARRLGQAVRAVAAEHAASAVRSGASRVPAQAGLWRR